MDGTEGWLHLVTGAAVYFIMQRKPCTAILLSYCVSVISCSYQAEVEPVTIATPKVHTIWHKILMGNTYDEFDKLLQFLKTLPAKLFSSSVQFVHMELKLTQLVKFFHIIFPNSN